MAAKLCARARPMLQLQSQVHAHAQMHAQPHAQPHAQMHALAHAYVRPVAERMLRSRSLFAESIGISPRRLRLSTSSAIFAPAASDDDDQPRPRPAIFRVTLQNPFRWLRLQIELDKIRREWDPDFDKSEFISGAKQAIATVTQLISESAWDELRGLLVAEERARLRQEVEAQWSDAQRRDVGLDVEDVEAAYPMRVNQQAVGHDKHCDIDVLFMCVKSSGAKPRNVIVIQVKARFYRDYSAGGRAVLPNWTISKFNVRRLR